MMLKKFRISIPMSIESTVTVKLYDFDWDNDGFIRVVSVARKGSDLPDLR